MSACLCNTRVPNPSAWRDTDKSRNNRLLVALQICFKYRRNVPITHYPRTERIVVQPFTVYDIKEDGIWHVERLKVTTVPSSICVCNLIFAPLKILSHLKNWCCGFCKYYETDTSLTFCAADGKNHDSASSQSGLHILCFCDLFLACHESSEGLYKNI